MHQYVAYVWVKSLWLIEGAQMERVQLDSMIFPSGAMAVGGIVSRSVIRSDGMMPPGVRPTVRRSTQEKWCLISLLKAGRVGVDERWFGSEFQIFGATDENDLDVAMEVLRKGTLIDKDEEDQSDRTGAYRGMSTAR